MGGFEGEEQCNQTVDSKEKIKGNRACSGLGGFEGEEQCNQPFDHDPKEKIKEGQRDSDNEKEKEKEQKEHGIKE